jgi:hypothetical protein
MMQGVVFNCLLALAAGLQMRTHDTLQSDDTADKSDVLIPELSGNRDDYRVFPGCPAKHALTRASKAKKTGSKGGSNGWFQRPGLHDTCAHTPARRHRRC